MAVFDARWRFTGLCDYTNLRLGGSAAVHSGDLTSAPEPLGASEFVDLDVAALRAIGGRYAVPIVFSYNDVPFDELVRGFAGFMDDPDGLFDPLAVRQRFDLTGPAKILVPLVADLWSRTMRRVDLNVSAFGGFHNVYGYEDQLARLGAGGRGRLRSQRARHPVGDRLLARRRPRPRGRRTAPRRRREPVRAPSRRGRRRLRVPPRGRGGRQTPGRGPVWRTRVSPWCCTTTCESARGHRSTPCTRSVSTPA